MKNLFVILTNSINKQDIDSTIISWLGKEDHIILSDINIPEMNTVGIIEDDGTSYNINFRLFYFIKNYKDKLIKYDWITFLDDTSFVFKDNIRRELEVRSNYKNPRILGSNQFSNCDYFNSNHSWNGSSDQMFFNLKTGISINNAFLSQSISIIERMKNNKKDAFLKETKLDDSFFFKLSECIGSKIVFMKNRIFINYLDDFKENFENYSIIGGLNPLEKTLIMKSQL